MIRTYLSLLFAIGSLRVGWAQEARLAVKAGLSVTSFVGDRVTSGSSVRFGFHGGILYDISISKHLAVQPELLYSAKGAADLYTPPGANSIKSTQRLHYFDVPILLKARGQRFFVEAGPQLGLLLGASREITSGANPVTIDNKPEFAGYDVGYVLGLGFQATSGPLLGLRYNGGLTNAVKEAGIYSSAVPAAARNSAVQLYLGYRFKASVH